MEQMLGQMPIRLNNCAFPDNMGQIRVSAMHHIICLFTNYLGVSICWAASEQRSARFQRWNSLVITCVDNTGDVKIEITFPETPFNPLHFSWIAPPHLLKVCQKQSPVLSLQLQNLCELLITSIISQACLKRTHDLTLLSQHGEFCLPLRRRDPCNDRGNGGAEPGILLLLYGS